MDRKDRPVWRNARCIVTYLHMQISSVHQSVKLFSNESYRIYMFIEYSASNKIRLSPVNV